ncbi:1526_t:CDS:2, partial [Gigaspora margarita]
NLNSFYCTTTITRPTKRKQQLKAARAKKCAKKSHVFCKQTDYEDLVWSDQDIDERASDYFAVLLTASKNEKIWKPSSRPSIYIEGSKRTQRRKKAELKKAAQYTRSITTYFAPTLTCESSMELHVSTEVESMEIEPVDVESVESVKSVEIESVKSVEVESVEVEPAENKNEVAIKELDGMLKKDDDKMDKGWGDYKARCIGAWAQNWIKQMVFLPMMSELEPLLLEYDNKDLTMLIEKDIPLEEKRHCVITHDETTLSANDDEKSGWGPEGEQKIRPKGQGRGIHVSEFLCEPLGHVHLTKE